MLQPQPAPAGAMCATHVESAADSVCTRCGNFMCTVCSDNRTGALCPACRQALGTFPFKRDDYDFSRVWNYCFDTWRRDLVMLGIAGAVMAGLGVVGQVVMQLFSGIGQAMLTSGGKDALAPGIIVMVFGLFVGMIVTILVQGIGVMGLVRLAIDSLHGRKVEIPRMFTQAKKVWSYGGIQLAIGAGITLPMMVGLALIFALAVLAGGGSFSSSGLKHAFDGPVPFIIIILGGGGLIFALTWLVLPLTFAQFELVYSGCSAMEALRRAWMLGSGHRLPTFGYTFVAGMVVFLMILAGILALCVGVMIAAPIGYALMFMVQAGLFLSLRNGSGLPPPEES